MGVCTGHTGRITRENAQHRRASLSRYGRLVARETRRRHGSADVRERESVAAGCDRRRSCFLMHCHHMVREDMGMMMNYTIV